MNYNFQRNQVKPTAKCCNWCKHLSDDFECTLLCNKAGYLTHRQILKLFRENEFRYCKNYRYSKSSFKRYKKMCEDNTKFTFGQFFSS